MNKLLFCLALALVVVSTVAERSKFTLQPMGLRVNNQTPNNHMWMDAKDDLLIYSNFIASPVESAVLRRNNQGVYINVANISMSLYAVTNGKFIASYGEGMTLYSIDENNQLSEGFNLSSLSGGCLFGDNYFVGFENSGDGNDTLRTYQYEATSDTWTEINDGVEIGNGFWQGPQASFYAINNRLIVADTFTDVEGFEARIYELQTDKSWKLTDTFPLNGTTGTMGTVTYNGIDTFVYGLPNSLEAAGSDVPVYGIVDIYTKVNGKWVEQKLTAAGVGYRPISFFGFYNKFVEDGTLIISAAYEGNLMTGSFEGGKILLLTRDSNGVWVPQLDLVSENGILGSAVALSDTEIIAVAVDARAPNGYYLTFHRTSRCFYKPMNVTCNNQQIDNCSDVEVEELFTLNNPECGSVSSSIRGFSLIDNQAVEAQVMLQKSIGSAVYCNVTVTCPAAKTPAFVSGSEARYLSFAAAALLIMHLL